MAGPQQLPPDFFDSEPFSNHKGAIFGICIPFMIFTWIVVMGRLYIRIFIAKSPGLDDLFVVLALLLISMGTISFMVAVKYGVGQHVYLLSPHDIKEALIFVYLFGVSYNCSTAFIKISLLLQYLRVFEPRTWIYRFTQLLLVIISLWGICYGFLAWFPCLPHPSTFWDGSRKGCYAAASANFQTQVETIESQAGSNFVFDVLVLALAFRLLFLKEAPTTKKGLLILIFFGTLSGAFGAWRLAEIVNSDAGRSADLTWSLPASTLLSICEVDIAVLVASTPFFWPIIKQQLDKIYVSHEFTITTESRFHGETSMELREHDHSEENYNTYHAYHDSQESTVKLNKQTQGHVSPSDPPSKQPETFA